MRKGDRKVGKKFQWGFFFILMLLIAPAAAAEEVMVEAEGFAVVSGGNLFRARELAVNDALRSAVEQVVGLLVDSTTRVRNYEIIENFLTRFTGYVAGYEILETRLVEETLTVQVRVRVRQGSVIQDINALELTIRQAGDPRIMVLVPERHIQRFVPEPAAETEIIRFLLEAGFHVVDQARVARIRESEVLRRVIAGDVDACQHLAADYGADILVAGEAFSELAGDFQGLISCRGRVEVRVIKADTGEIVAVDGVYETGIDITESAASKKALAKAGSTMARRLMEMIPAGLTDTNRNIQVIVGNLSFSDVLLLQQKLRETPMVDSIYLRDYFGGGARLDVKTTLSSIQLGKEMTWWEELPLEVTGLSGGKIELRKKD